MKHIFQKVTLQQKTFFEYEVGDAKWDGYICLCEILSMSEDGCMKRHRNAKSSQQLVFNSSLYMMFSKKLKFQSSFKNGYYLVEEIDIYKSQ